MEGVCKLDPNPTGHLRESGQIVSDLGSEGAGVSLPHTYQPLTGLLSESMKPVANPVRQSDAEAAGGADPVHSALRARGRGGLLPSYSATSTLPLPILTAHSPRAVTIPLVSMSPAFSNRGPAQRRCLVSTG